MSSFGARRKAKVIITEDDGAGVDKQDRAAGATTSSDGKLHRDSSFTYMLNASKADGMLFAETGKTAPGIKTAKKPFRQSGLRKTISAADDEDDQDGGPAVVRPTKLGAQKKKKAAKTKLSFGADQAEDGDDEPAVKKPVKPAPGLGQRAFENSASKRLPLRSFQEDEDDRPKYSREYLDELQSSTPTTPRDTPALSIHDSDAMDLDTAELEGALIVDSPDIPTPVHKTQILTDAEIREKKERRARLAKEQDFLSVDDLSDDDSAKKKSDTRLKAEDEELGEGFDDYVEDGGLSLGKRAEKERRKRDRQKMAELITAAEGNDSDSSSDSDDAEGRIAYEAAQTRAGMDGLKKPPKQDAEKELLQIPQKITPLPILSECIARLQSTLQSMQVDITSKRSAVDHLRKERDGITTREAEVQKLLDETGKKYQETMRQSEKSESAVAVATEARGLESLGTTPSREPMDET